MILITGCNAPYFNRMMPYLDSLRTHADFPVLLVGVGFQPPKLAGIDTVQISKDTNYGAPKETESIQHGSFTAVVDAEETDVIVYTDGDFIMQRPMDDNERKFLNLSHGQVATSWNGGPGETLGHEAGRIYPKVSDAELTQMWGEGWQDRPIYNVGFLAMTRQTWEKLHAAYLEHWEMACSAFTHQARQQWLISYLLDTLFDVIVAPWHLHAHGHFGLKPGMERRVDGIYADGKKALFRHFI